ncbi:RNA-directed DNA polymerase, eukaryota [Tanacetum coccineum]|uniref:RNA-directed DNA polymerase, eukaryota n=1 Tax=Tanacetum coccineum TaxID=301880 RepID=A0ABQ4YGA4_9ASTR
MENVDVNDIKVFRKLNATISDYFIAIQGLWVFNDKRLMIIAVYAPQEASEKRMLWEYLNHVINNWNEGCSFTWVHKSASKMSKLDRFLISEGLIEACPNISAISLDRYLSDHRPILLREFYVDYGPVPFRFYHYWYEFEGFDSFVEEVWKEQGYSDVNAFDAFMIKLRNLKAKIRIWIKARKEKSSIQKTKLKGMLTDLDLVIDKGEANSDILNKRLHILKDIQLIEKLNTLEVAQKSKIKWAIKVDGAWLESPNLVKEEFLNHFKDRFDHPVSSRLILDMDFPNTLSLDQRDELEISISKDEFKRVVWDCGLDKSPGLDGGNSLFITLIPKIQDAKMVKDFRPISLIGSSYKIIAKILANRLVVVLGDLVNEVQSAFIANGQILDGPFIVNELIKDRWRGWIQSSLSSSRGSILVNGSPTNEFQFYKGLKQGDPLSPFLFILVMESLHLSFQNVVNEGMFEGISIGSSMKLSNFFYADDVVFMGHWSDSNISFIVQVLECFFHASGLRINMQKSKLMGIGVDDVKISKAAKSIGCLTFMTPFSYLGVKVGGKTSIVKSWDEIVNKLFARLSKWKMKTLSIGGRLTLLKSVLGSTPIYYMSFFKVPTQVLNKMESIRSRFFNGADEKEKKSSWVSWKKVLAAKKKEGLIMMVVHDNNGSIESLYRSSHSSTWLDIIQDFQQLKSKGMNLFNFIKKRIGNDEKSSFWEELVQVDMAGSFRHPPRGGVELQQYTCFRSNLEDVILSNSQDRWLWSLTGSCEFSVASKVKLDGLPTRFNLSRRGIDINSINCPCCVMAVETTSHLFFTCSMVRELYRKIAIWWDIKLMEVDSFEGWTVWMSDIRLHGFRKEVTEGFKDDSIRFGEEFLKVFVAYDRRATGSRGVGDNVRSHGKYNESAHVGIMDGKWGTTFSRDNNKRFVDVVSGRNEKESCIEIEDNKLNSELLGRSITGEVKVMCFLTKLPSFCEEEGLGKEAVASENASKIEDEVGDKMGENDMIIDEEDDENRGEPNGKGELSDGEKDDEDGEGNEDEYGDGVPDMISGGWKHGEDEESKLSRELTVRENFKEMVVESNAKSAGPYEKIHGNYKRTRNGLC